MLARLEERHHPWDMIVIGGGATGVGIAVDAASRGYDVLLLEQHDFGKGTSSRSTKLVHGGVRYLEQGNIALVMEALKERGLLRQNAPHLVSNLAFVVPNYDWWEAPFYGLGLKIYNVLAGKYGFGTSEILSRAETLSRLPTIKTDGLLGGVVYYDGQFDDARLLINLVETAADQGAVLVNYVRVVAMTKGADGFVDGIVATDQESGRQWTIAARVIVNAAGPVFRLGAPAGRAGRGDADGAEPGHPPRVRSLLSVVRGGDHGAAHVGRPRDVRDSVARSHARRHHRHADRHGHAGAATARGGDRVRPRDGRPVPAQASHARRCPECVRRHPSAGQSGDGKLTAALSRDHTIHIDASGLLTTTGGKWTTYRNMAEHAVDQAADLGRLEERPCVTRTLNVHGYHSNADRFGALGVYGSTRRRFRI
jgi:glycerol-3-phosphate dehydrogenase